MWGVGYGVWDVGYGVWSKGGVHACMCVFGREKLDAGLRNFFNTLDIYFCVLCLRSPGHIAGRSLQNVCVL